MIRRLTNSHRFFDLIFFLQRTKKDRHEKLPGKKFGSPP
jgi:hypothetical protein